MNSRNILTESISHSIEISIKALNESLTTGSKVYAINWFNLKRPVLYSLYNTLVGPMLHKIGGRLFFKGILKKRLEGNDTDERKMLLLVYYPSPLHFIRLLKKKIFQLASILRITSVKEFNFGFCQRLMGEGPPLTKKTDNLNYVVHHFKMKQAGISGLEALQKELATLSISLFFCGELAAHIVAKKGNKKAQQAPILMDGIILYESAKEKYFDQLMSSPLFAEFKAQFDSNYMAAFERIG